MYKMHHVFESGSVGNVRRMEDKNKDEIEGLD